MADFIIPKGKDFAFTIKVIEKESFLAQDLTNMATATMELYKNDTLCVVDTIALTVKDALNGILVGEIPAVTTVTLEYDRGSKIDGYYLRPTYQATISVTFNDTTEPITTTVNEIYVSPTGVTCV